MSEVGVIWWCSMASFNGVFLQTPLNTIVRAFLNTEFPFAPKEAYNCCLHPYTVVNIPKVFIYVTIYILPFFSLATDSNPCLIKYFNYLSSLGL